ncbi:hypothetical protein BC940DRAFT_122149 [Gongronella butleri]|nr:hypothetical protein BC940DRAFT_122149 [Gongronella butleri]
MASESSIVQTPSTNPSLSFDFSGLMSGTPPPTTQVAATPTAVAPPSSSAVPSSSGSVSSVVPTTTTGSSASKDDGGFTTAQLGAIIGGVAGGFFLLVALFAFLLCRQRRRSSKKFKRGRGITPSMVLDRNYTSPHPYPQQQQQHSLSSPYTSPATLATSFDEERNNYQSKNMPYSFDAPQNAFGSQHFTPTSPSENVTAAVDEIYNLKQYNQQHDASFAPQPRVVDRNEQRKSRASANGARLSKYNYLTEAFQQMRASYAQQQQPEMDDAPAPQQMQDMRKKESKIYSDEHPGLAAPPFVQYPDPVHAGGINMADPNHANASPVHMNGRTNAAAHQQKRPTQPQQQPQQPQQSQQPQPPQPPQPQSRAPTQPRAPAAASARPLKPAMKQQQQQQQSLMPPTPGGGASSSSSPTLHRGIVANSTISVSNAQSTAVTKKLHFPGMPSNDRDSVVSDVSEYSTFSTGSDAYKYDDAAHRPSPLANEKPYTYI